jgi:hypothetical protein
MPSKVFDRTRVAVFTAIGINLNLFVKDFKNSVDM